MKVFASGYVRQDLRVSYKSKGQFDRLCVIKGLSSQENVCDWGLVEEGERRVSEVFERL